MRLLPDAHVSARAIARTLRDRGHDVRAADEERALDGWDHESLLEPAASEGRIMVTFNVRDFPRIVGQWAAAGRHHTGCLIIVGIDHSELGLILRPIDGALAVRSDHAAWRDLASWGTRGWAVGAR